MWLQLPGARGIIIIIIIIIIIRFDCNIHLQLVNNILQLIYV